MGQGDGCRFKSDVSQLSSLPLTASKSGPPVDYASAFMKGYYATKPWAELRRRRACMKSSVLPVALALLVSAPVTATSDVMIDKSRSSWNSLAPGKSST